MQDPQVHLKHDSDKTNLFSFLFLSLFGRILFLREDIRFRCPLVTRTVHAHDDSAAPLAVEIALIEWLLNWLFFGAVGGSILQVEIPKSGNWQVPSQLWWLACFVFGQFPDLLLVIRSNLDMGGLDY